MSDIAALVADNLDIWTGAIERKNGAGRAKGTGGGKRISLYGIERLRALILDLAVRGKLVPQDAGDEPAAELLARIAQERRELIRQGKISKPKALPKVDHSEISVPQSWAISRFGDLFSLEYGDNLPQPKRSGTGEYKVYGSNGVVGSHDNYSIEHPCIVVGRKGSAGALNMSFEPCWVTDVAYYCIPPKDVELRFQYILFQTLGLDVLGKGIKPGLNRNEANVLLLAIPPLTEQRRIIAKVDELMALCDALERESAGALAAHQTLVETLLATLVQSADAAELATNWTRLESHFDTLFTTEASIDALEQTILDLAVRGKLVEQDAGDESALALVQDWRKAKTEALKSAGDRRIKAAPDPKAAPFSLPSHWTFQSFENIFLFVDYRGNTPPKTSDGIPLITAKNVRMGYLDREPKEFISEATFLKWMTRGFPKPGDLFFTTEAPLGNICQNDVDEPFAIAQRLICFQPYGEVNTRFFMMAIMSRSMQRVLDDHATGMTARGIKAAKLKLLPLPVPPLAEQRRIVAKVDEIMALCDTLKSRIAGAAETRRHLADAITQRAAA